MAADFKTQGSETCRGNAIRSLPTSYQGTGHFRMSLKSLNVSKLQPLLLLVALAFVLVTGTVKADGPASCSFSGTVKLDGADVAGGTLVTAIINGDEYHTHTPPGLGSSSYSIAIKSPEGKNYPDGEDSNCIGDTYTAICYEGEKRAA